MLKLCLKVVIKPLMRTKACQPAKREYPYKIPIQGVLHFFPKTLFY